MVRYYNHIKIAAVEETDVFYLGHRVEGEVINSRYSAGELTCAYVKICWIVDHNFLVGYWLKCKHIHTEQWKMSSELIQPEKCKRQKVKDQ